MRGSIRNQLAVSFYHHKSPRQRELSTKLTEGLSHQNKSPPCAKGGFHQTYVSYVRDLFRLSYTFLFLFLFIPILFAENAPAIFLHIQPQIPGNLLPFPEIRTKIPIDKCHTVFLRCLPCSRLNSLMVLIRTDQQRCAESIVSMFSCIARRGGHTHTVTICTSVVKIRTHRLHKGTQSVFILQ